MLLDHPWLQNTRQAPETSLGETVRSRLRQFSAMNKLRKKALRVIPVYSSFSPLQASSFFLLSSSPEIVIPQDTNAIRFHGPFKAFNDSELELLKKINEDWRKFRTSMKETFERTGLMQPWDKSCFIWLPECYLLAKHEKIIQVRVQRLHI